MTEYWVSLLGGMMIGLSAVMLLLVNGRIAGISGIVGRLLDGVQVATNLAFVIGLMLGPIIYVMLFGNWSEIRIETPLFLIAVAGLLVGFGTRLGCGCTSGHGILGMARFSKRSLVATITFLVVGMLVASLKGILS